jgi:hypothetical protein
MGDSSNFPKVFSFTREGQRNVIMNNSIYVGDDLIPILDWYTGNPLIGEWFMDEDESSIIFVLPIQGSNNVLVFVFYSNNQVVFFNSGENANIASIGNNQITITQLRNILTLPLTSYSSTWSDYNSTPISNICFIAKTPILTNQGLINIENIDSDIHTIRNKKIMAITKTITQDKHLICFEKDSIDKNIPSQKTIMSKNHVIYYKGNVVKAKDFIGKFENVYKIKYSGEVLYNVLMETHDKMMVNNLICETLHPENQIAKIYKTLPSLSFNVQQEYIKKYNEAYIKHSCSYKK